MFRFGRARKGMEGKKAVQKGFELFPIAFSSQRFQKDIHAGIYGRRQNGRTRCHL